MSADKPGDLPNNLDDIEPVTGIKTPIKLTYEVRAGIDQSRFLRAVMERRLIGATCPVTHKVYCPPKGGSPVGWVETEGEVEVQQTGTVTTFCIVRMAFEGQQLEPPYAVGAILPDGSDTTLLHLIGGPADEVRMGMRVKAVWHEGELPPTLGAIKYFEPIAEPDAPYERYKEHL